ncbi:MAG: L,D-transpeptidase family protein [candidate division KSB1 bacterium]|nr:L,D-transpeptidase family protein [candidate division KSB1 bacterium]
MYPFAVGRVKFMFPNRFNVYPHETPASCSLTRTERAFSSGCIHIEKPIELAEYLLRGDPKWTRVRIEAAVKWWQGQTVRLPAPIPIHLHY